MTIENVTSLDGTRLAVERTGSGPPLVLVHGTTADRSRWAPVLPALAARATVYALDRRGRGGSGDTAPYAIEREYEDVAAVCDAIGGPVDLLGHSYGAICSLEASLRAARLRRLVLYEPPVPSGLPIHPPGIAAKLDALLAAGERDRVIETWMTEIVRVPPAELAILRARPAWAARVAAAHTLGREAAASSAYVFEPARFAAMRTPTLLLLGGDSPRFFGAAIERVAAALPDARVGVMPGQQHTAMDTAPELFVREVHAFLA
jgi:pimeloyl-ACP methyl ester carboxylesterase